MQRFIKMIVAVLPMLFLMCATSASLRSSLDAPDSQNDPNVRRAKGGKIEFIAKPVTNSVNGIIGLHLWNSFQVTVKNLTANPIKMDPLASFMLLHKQNGTQYNALSLDDVYTHTSTVLGSQINLSFAQRNAISSVYFKGGMILPGANISGVIFFDKNQFSFDFQGGDVLYFVNQDLNETLSIQF